MQRKRLYIAYGSNLDTWQMSNRCPGARPVAKSWLHDYRLVFQGMPLNAHANVIPEKGQKVPVVVWEISAANEKALDRYEGVKGGYYTKEYFTIEVNGEMVEALIYIMCPRDFNLPCDIYLETIAYGYHDFNFDIRYLKEAAKHAHRHADYVPA